MDYFKFREIKKEHYTLGREGDNITSLKVEPGYEFDDSVLVARGIFEPNGAGQYDAYADVAFRQNPSIMELNGDGWTPYGVKLSLIKTDVKISVGEGTEKFDSYFAIIAVNYAEGDIRLFCGIPITEEEALSPMAGE